MLFIHRFQTQVPIILLLNSFSQDTVSEGCCLFVCVMFILPSSEFWTSWTIQKVKEIQTLAISFELKLKGSFFASCGHAAGRARKLFLRKSGKVCSMSSILTRHQKKKQMVLIHCWNSKVWVCIVLDTKANSLQETTMRKPRFVMKSSLVSPNCLVYSVTVISLPVLCWSLLWVVCLCTEEIRKSRWVVSWFPPSHKLIKCICKPSILSIFFFTSWALFYTFTVACGHLDQVALQELFVSWRTAQPGAAEGRTSGVWDCRATGMAEGPGTQNRSPPSWEPRGGTSVMTW